jgi:putative peptidoglycan lipid II flippase
MAGEREILRSASVVGANTLLSRILGYVRDRVIAYLLGTSLFADAFYALFRLPNTFRRLMGEGALTAAVVPVFTEVREREGAQAGWALAARLFFVVAAVLAVVTLAGVVFSAQILSVTGFAGRHADVVLEDAVSLNRIIFPYLFFICLAALAMALLNSVGVFGPSAFTPVLLNLCIIAAALLFGRRMEEPVRALAWGVLAGGILQLSFQVPFLWRRGFRLRTKGKILSRRVLEVAWLFVPAAFGAGITQINILVGTLVATYLAPGSVSSLYYADRIMELTYGVYALGIATVILPAMSRFAARGELEHVKETLVFALRATFFIMIPSAAGLILLRGPIVETLFLGGSYDARSAEMTAFALLFYALGLAGYAAVKVIVAVFYAEKDTKTPVRAAFAAFAANILLMAWLVGPLSHGGIALATSCAAYLNAGLLFAVFLKRRGRIALGELGASLARTLAATAVMGAAVWFSAEKISLHETAALGEKALRLGVVIAAGAGVYFLVAALLRAREIGELRSVFRRKLPGSSTGAHE